MVLGGDVGGLVVLVSAIVGFTVSLWGYYSYSRGSETPICRPGGKVNCLAVYSIPQAWILGFHLSSIAPYYYGLTLVLALISTTTWWEPALRVLAVTQWGGLLVVPYLVYLELFIARSICIYCTIMHVSTLAIALLMLDELLEALAITGV
ncbi:MAG: vitamin K epoxide reductase family protein [Acidilobaceae archaeon]